MGDDNSLVAKCTFQEALDRVLEMGGGDLYRLVASEMFGIDPAAVPEELRRDIKRCCFAHLYSAPSELLGGQDG